MLLKKWLNTPKVMAMPGFLAFLMKATIASVLAFGFILTTKNPSFFKLMLVVYPFIAITIDLILLRYKHIWRPLPDSAVIPEDWGVTKEELLKYAQNIPKVRLMRGLAALLITPLFLTDTHSGLAEVVRTFSTLFFICALFDGFFKKLFSLKEPKFLIKKIEIKSSEANFDTRRNFDMSNRDAYDPYCPGSVAWNLRRMHDR